MVQQIHTLIIDIGNSNVKYHYRGKTYYLLEEFLLSCCDTPIQAHIVSVDQAKTVALLIKLQQSIELQSIDIFDPVTAKPLQNAYPELGADRIAKVCGALKMFSGQDVILMDFGTATTLTICTKDYKFVRGLIHLGLHSYINAIRSQCPSLTKFVTDDLFQVDCSKSSVQQAILEAAIREHHALVADDLGYACQLLARPVPKRSFGKTGRVKKDKSSFRNKSNETIITIATGGLGEAFVDKFDHYVDSRVLLEAFFKTT